VLDTLEEVVEEPALVLQRSGLVVDDPLAPPLGVEPLVLRGDLQETVDRASRVQALVGPAGADQGRNQDVFEPRPLQGKLGDERRAVLRRVHRLLV
jgi:hypothetical protein